MTQLVRRQGPWGEIQDLHTRVRRLEANPGGSDPTVCPDCVLQPYTVVPGAIPIDPELRECVDVTPVSFSFGDVCDNTATVTLLGAQYIAPGGNFLAGFRPNVQFFSSDVGPLGNAIENFIVSILVGPDMGSLSLDSTWVKTFDPVLPSTVFYVSGGVQPQGTFTAACHDVIAVALSFAPNNTVFGSCRGGGELEVDWYYDPDDLGFRGALDDLPQGDAYGDTIHFNSVTHEWDTGPRSVPSRAFSYFNGG